MAKYINFGDWPVTRKISFIVLLTSGILIAVMVFAITLEKSLSYRAKLEKNSAVLAQITGANSTAALTFEDSDTAYEILTALKAEKDIIEAVLYNAEGQLFSDYFNSDYYIRSEIQQLPNPLSEENLNFNISLTAPWFDTLCPILLNGKTIGHILLRTNLTSLISQLQLFLIVVSCFALVLLALAMIVTSRLNQAILDPVSRLAGTMKDVTVNQNYDVRVTKTFNDEIGVLIGGFNTMLKQISKRDAELSTYRNHLEELVSTRTAELKIANEQLLHEVEERQEVQKRLAHAQKMEAIGTLAGGVAHDLNNILSGIVSYPDLLLMQLPEDSSLRKPLETIRTSGKKAAAIVQDLLTLARRGVKTEEQIELQSLVAQYLDSPECREMLRSHPGVEVNFRQKGEQFYMSGSPVHLLKTVMNLVSNSAEAIPDTGRIDISLDKISRDSHPEDFTQLEGEEYLRLTVADTGIGIGEQYLERIFEPFYSRKVMGKSGTGLGMAVVWGTVEDHKGHITVESKEGEGTTFNLCFPVRTDPPAALALTRQAEEQYKGHGQSVLVVDDNEQQRQIASDILTHLGYAAASVPSGETAVQYLSKQTADLVILDMLMDPGMNGLETYRKILEFRPGQKAIIASGYSKKEPIDEARALGVSEYVVKPYTVSRIGRSVFSVLQDKEE